MMMELILGLVGSFVLTEIHVCLPAFARWVVRRHVATLPSGLRERMAEEWLAEVEACPSHVQKVIFALGLLTGTGDLVRAHGEQQARASTRDKTGVTGDVTVTLTGVSATGHVGNLTAVAPGDHGLPEEAPNAVIRVSDTITVALS